MPKSVLADARYLANEEHDWEVDAGPTRDRLRVVGSASAAYLQRDLLDPRLRVAS